VPQGVLAQLSPQPARCRALESVTFCVGQAPARCRAAPSVVLAECPVVSSCVQFVALTPAVGVEAVQRALESVTICNALCRAGARCRAVPSRRRQVSGSRQPGVGRQVSGRPQRRCRAVPSECPKTCQNLPKLARCRAPGVEQSPARCRAVPGRPGVGQAPGVEQSPGDKTLGADLPQGFSVQLSPQRRRQVSGSPQPGVGQAPAVGAYRLPTACLPRPPALFP
jgi:hypothetical protein